MRDKSSSLLIFSFLIWLADTYLLFSHSILVVLLFALLGFGLQYIFLYFAYCIKHSDEDYSFSRAITFGFIWTLAASIFVFVFKQTFKDLFIYTVGAQLFYYATIAIKAQRIN